MGLVGLLTAKAAISVFGVANVVAGTLCLATPVTAAAAPVFFAAAEAAIITVVAPVDPISAAAAVITGPL